MSDPRTNAAPIPPNRTSYDSALARVGKGAGVVLVGLLVGTSLEYVVRIILARVLGPDTYGLFELGYSVILFLSTASLLGMGTSLVRYVAFYLGKNDPASAKGVIFTGFWINLVVTLLVGAAIWFGSSFFANNVLRQTNFEPVLRLFLIALPLMSVSALFLAALRGFSAMKEWIIAHSLGMNLLRFAVVASLMLVFPSLLTISAVVIIYIMGFSVRLLLSAYYLRRQRALDWGITADFSVAPDFVRSSLPLMLSDIISEVRRNLEVLLLGYFATTIQIGFFSAAALVGQLINIPIAALERVFVPVASGMYAQAQDAEVSRLYVSSARWIFYIVTPPLVCLLLFAEPIAITVFGSRYGMIAPTLRILILGNFVNGATGLWEQVLLAKARNVLVMQLRLVWVFTSIVTAAILIPRLGYIGAAWSSSLPLVLIHVLGIVILYHYERVQPFGMRQVRFLLATLFVFFIAYWVVNTGVILHHFFILSLVVSCTVAYLLSLAVAGLDSDDRYVISLVMGRFAKPTLPPRV